MCTNSDCNGLSRHARIRLATRTSLSMTEIAAILEKRLTVNLGHKPGILRDHLLFYSAPDDTCFVALQDSVDGTVVTVLPLDYHASLAWEVSQDDCARAKALVIEAQTAAPPLSTYFHIMVHYTTAEGGSKIKNIRKIKAEKFNHDLSLFKASVDADNLFRESMPKLSMPARNIFAMTVRLGFRGLPTSFEGPAFALLTHSRATTE